MILLSNLIAVEQYDYVIKSGLPFIILANKADKIAITKVDNAVNDLQNQINPMKDARFLPFSAERKIYQEPVWNEIEKYIYTKTTN